MEPFLQSMSGISFSFLLHFDNLIPKSEIHEICGNSIMKLKSFLDFNFQTSSWFCRNRGFIWSDLVKGMKILIFTGVQPGFHYSPFSCQVYQPQFYPPAGAQSFQALGQYAGKQTAMCFNQHLYLDFLGCSLSHVKQKHKNYLKSTLMKRHYYQLSRQMGGKFWTWG